MQLSQAKRVEDPSTNPLRFENVALNSPKPLWRSTRPLEGKHGLPAVYKRSETKDYHEERFGWRSGFWTMWDTEPTGTKNAIRLAPDDVMQSAAFHKIRQRPHDDPCRMQRESSINCVVAARCGHLCAAWFAALTHERVCPGWFRCFSVSDRAYYERTVRVGARGMGCTVLQGMARHLLQGKGQRDSLRALSIHLEPWPSVTRKGNESYWAIGEAGCTGA